MNKLSLLLTTLPIIASALEIEPWFDNVYEFHAIPAYTFSWYNKVQNGTPSRHVSRDSLVDLGLLFTPAEYWSIDLEAELVRTAVQNFSFRSAAIQSRYLWLDDLRGDPVGLTFGFDVRGVGHKSLTDVSCPYNAPWNFQLTSAVGKEWSQGPNWLYRPYLFFAVGFGNHGSPWIQFRPTFQANINNKHQFELFGFGYFGFGGRDVVEVNHFHGYAHIRHQSLDFGLVYRYVFDVWGTLSLGYTTRAYAHCFPEFVNAFTLKYDLGFSVF
jgi:hypothetical protein